MIFIKQAFEVGRVFTRTVATGRRRRTNRLAAEKGHPGGNYNLGLVYDRGYGIEVNGLEAFKHYYLAATNGVDLVKKVDSGYF